MMIQVKKMEEITSRMVYQWKIIYQRMIKFKRRVLRLKLILTLNLSPPPRPMSYIRQTAHYYGSCLQRDAVVRLSISLRQCRLISICAGPPHHQQLLQPLRTRRLTIKHYMISATHTVNRRREDAKATCLYSQQVTTSHFEESVNSGT